MVVLALIIGMMPVTTFAETNGDGGNVFYIRNNYTSGAYMYESDGVLRYGIPIAGDKQFQWQIIEAGENKVIRNVATNHCITLEGHADETVEGYWGDKVPCLDFTDGNDTFLWSFTIGEAQNMVSASTKYAGYGLHLENVTNGQVCGQKLSSDQLNWGNMKWDFVTEKDINFASMVRDGFCVQNAESGSYLRVDNGVLTYGTPSGPDDAYIWVIDEQPDGTKTIKNKLTSQYLSMTNYNTADFSLGCANLSAGDAKFLWNFQLSKEAPILSANPDNKGYGLYLDKSSEVKAKCAEIASKEGYPAPGMKWNFIIASQVAGVCGPLMLEDGVYNLKNSWFAMFMIEDNGVAIYGNAKPSDKNAQWRIVYDKTSGLTALKNEGTGHYLHLNSYGKLVCDSVESYYWNLQRNKNALYPDAVEFQDSVNTTSFLHMESLSGVIEDTNAVQPNWGTPHWEPIKYDAAANGTQSGTAFTVPTGYIRLKNANAGEYLYENSAGAIVYGDVKASDARSHWEIVESGVSGNYFLVNREYENYLTNKSNGTLRGLSKEEATGEGSLWQISSGDAANSLIINGADSKLAAYSRPYLNIKKLNGFAQSSLVSNEEVTVKWIYEAAQDVTASEAKQEQISVPINTFTDTNLYKISYNGTYLNSTYKLEYYGNSVRVIDTANSQYLYCEDEMKTKALTDNNDPLLLWQTDSKAGVIGLKNGKNKIQLEVVPSDSVYPADGAYVNGHSIVFTVYADQPGTYKAGIGYSGSNSSVDLKINGISQGAVSLPVKGSIDLALNKGINTVSLSNDANVSALTIFNSVNKNYRGATATYTEFEAEDCSTNGTPIEEDRTYRTLSSEASGRLATTLDGTGQYVKFTLTKAANAMVIRYCIPDSQDGTGLDASLNLYVNGRKNKSIELTSKYSWVYGGYPWTNNPPDGQAHHFYDEVRVLLDQTYPAGTVIKLQKDAINQAFYYIIDLVDMEEVAPSNPQPENSLSITDFGAIPNDGIDDTKAVYDCIKAAVAQGKEVWIPEGVFDINTPTQDYDAGDKQDKNRGFVLTDDNVVIRGAGMWRSVLKGDYAAFFVKANNISFHDFTLSGSATARRDAIDPSAIETDYNTPAMKNMTVQNLWIEHYKTGIWTHNMSGMHIVGCRIRNTFADGMNLRRGTSNSVVEQCDVRNTGDDAIALWSSDYNDTNDIIRFNTVSLQWLANNIALYGGKDIEVTDNIIKDTVGMGAGVNISTNFSPKPFEGTITVARNTLLRCGSHDPNYNQDDGAIWFNTVAGNDNHANVAVKDNLILDSSCQGISFMNKGTVDQVLLEGNVIDGCGSLGIDIAVGSKGAATARNNVIRNVMLGEINNGAESTFTLNIETTEEAQPVNSQEQKSVMPVILPVAAAIIIILLALAVLLKRKKHR